MRLAINHGQRIVSQNGTCEDLRGPFKSFITANRFVDCASLCGKEETVTVFDVSRGLLGEASRLFQGAWR